MGNKSRFSMPALYMVAHFSGWSGVKCETCKREITNAQWRYSTRFFFKPLCKSCQSLEVYSRKL